jgi:hypothetical protein
VELSTLIDWKRYILKLAQIVTGLTSYASLDSIYCETGWEKLIVRREVRKPNLFYKIINNGIFIRVDTSNSFRIK